MSLLRLLVCFSTSIIMHQSAIAQPVGKYDPARHDAKIALHAHYRNIVFGKHTKADKKMMNNLLGAWESADDSSLPKRCHAKKKVDVIQYHGLLFGKDDALLHNYYNNTMHRTRWLWGVKGDTIVYFIDAYSYGDTSVIVEQIVSLDKERIILKNLVRDTISTTLPCYTYPDIYAVLSMSKPRYAGDMQRYLQDALKDFNPKGENYEVLVKFMVNCKGVVGYAYPFAGDFSEFEMLVVDLIKKSGKWKPAAYNGETYDSYHHIEVQWNKGYIDFDYPKMNY